MTELEDTLRAIRCGEVDAVAGETGRQVFTLEGAGDAYRMLIESMNEGALTLTVDMTILYANQCFALMVKSPLEQVTGSSFRRFLSPEDGVRLRASLKRKVKSGSKILALMQGAGGSSMEVQISVRQIAGNSSDHATISMVVTDMTEARRNERLLRSLTQRIVHAQEGERGRVAIELHDGITQMLCAAAVRCQTMENTLSPGNKSAKKEAGNLGRILGQTVDEVSRIAHNLRPSVLDQLGLVAAMRVIGAEFVERTGTPVNLVCGALISIMPRAADLTFYRILQEALRNVEKHAKARHVTVDLTQSDGTMQLVIKDDGMGFDQDRPREPRRGNSGIGLLSMTERATAEGGTLKFKTAPRAGTEITVRIPLPKEAGGGHPRVQRSAN